MGQTHHVCLLSSANGWKERGDGLWKATLRLLDWSGEAGDAFLLCFLIASSVWLTLSCSLVSVPDALRSHGWPDLGIINSSDVVEDVRRITAVTQLPLLVDVDTGFGGAFGESFQSPLFRMLSLSLPFATVVCFCLSFSLCCFDVIFLLCRWCCLPFSSCRFLSFFFCFGRFLSLCVCML